MHARAHRRPARPGPPGVSRHRPPKHVIGSTNRRRDEARRVSDLLRSTIRRRDASITLPPEDALVDQFRTSRNTVREALDILREDGVLDRRRGLGTVMAPSAPRHDPSRIEGPSYFVHQGGDRIRYENLALAEIVPGDALADRLGTAPDEPVTLLERRTLLDDEVLAFRSGYTTAPVEAITGAHPDAIAGDYWDLLEDVCAQPLEESVSTVTAVKADASCAAHLGVDVGSLLVLIESLTYGADGRAVSFSFLRVPPQHFHITYRSSRS